MTSVDQTDFESSRAGNIATLLIGLAVAPVLALLAPRTFLSMIREGNVSLRTEANAAYFDECRQATGADEAACKAIIERLRGQIEADDWDGISADIRDWEARSANVPGTQARMADLALNFIRHELASHVYPPNMCNFEKYYEIPDIALARVQAAARARPADPVLTALLAQLHIDRGWCVRGGGWSSEVDEAGWQGLMDSFRTASALLARFEPREERSAILARVAFQLLAAEEQDHTVDRARDAYQAWSDLDVGNPLPHQSFAFFVLPRWYGSWRELEDEAQGSAKRTGAVIGKAAYAWIYLLALGWEEDALRLMDLDLFEAALDDLVRRDPNPSRKALEIALEIREATETSLVPIWSELFCQRALKREAALRDVARRLLEKHVTRLPAEKGSAFETKALDAIAWYFGRELKAGKRLSFTEGGLHFEA